MTDQPDRQDGDGLLRDIELLGAALEHGLHPSGVTHAFRRIKAALVPLPTRDGAEGDGIIGDPVALITRLRADETAPPKPAPDAMRGTLLDAQEGLRGLLAWTGATRNGVLSSEDRVAFEDDLKIALKARATVDRALARQAPHSSGDNHITKEAAEAATKRAT